MEPAVPCNRNSRRKRCGMDDLTDELLTEILVRVPLLWAHHSKLVCKRWYGLLSSSFFAQLFDNRNRNNFSILMPYWPLCAQANKPLLATHFTSLRGFSFVFLPESHNRRLPMLLASCNDLLLFRLESGTGRNLFVLCNPITEKWLPLPPPPPNHFSCSLFRFWGLLCFSSGRYAVVGIPFRRDQSHSTSEFIVEVFSSDTFQWTQKTFSFHPTVVMRPFGRVGAITYNGLLFWLYRGETRTGGLIAVDPFNLCRPPRFFDAPSAFCCNQAIGLCAGCLRFIQISEHPKLHCPCIFVWDLKLHDKGDNTSVGWVLYCEVASTNSVLPCQARVLSCHPNDRDVVYILIDDVCMSFNLLDQRLEVVTHVPFIKNLLRGSTCTFTLPWKPTQVLTPSLPHP